MKKEERDFVLRILEEIKDAIERRDAVRLKALSDEIMEPAVRSQEIGSLTLSTIVYTISKLIERRNFEGEWDKFAKKLIGVIGLAKLALKEGLVEKYREDILRLRKVLTSYSVNLKKYIGEVLKKASINKGAKLHEQGISIEQTAKLLGISQWELSDYIGQRDIHDLKQMRTIDVKKRAKMVLDFFGGEE